MDRFEKTRCFVRPEQGCCQTPSRFLRSKAAGELCKHLFIGRKCQKNLSVQFLLLSDFQPIVFSSLSGGTRYGGCGPTRISDSGVQSYSPSLWRSRVAPREFRSSKVYFRPWFEIGNSRDHV